MLAGGAAGLVLAALAARGLAGDLLGGEGQHLWIVAAPAAAGTLWAAWAARRGAEGAGAILLRMALGAGLGLVLIGLLSVAGLVRAVPPGAPRPDGPTTLFGQLGDYFWHITLPVAASTIASFATLTLLTKNSFLDEIRKQYVMTAKAKGLSEGRVLYGHVFRNAMLIVIAGFPGLFIAVFFGGSIIIETIFSLDGLGRLGFEAAVARNYPVIFGTLFFFGLVGLVVGILSDLMYVLVDPRIDFEARRT
ncbi:ABC transporter permease subunit [Hasllibacter halocynthiae]|uniref:ABC transporter permease subunit n=1 Tax=Hasllibacter halocynthiae TaxID=595589 RepID=UPI002481F17C|nr:ABC transporter permease subunit [Hasllibacter halocynthiae]